MAAEVGGGDGKKKPRIDMTPMVDLGFLLLTFFVLTTQMNEPISMKIKVPAKEETPPPQDELEKVPKERVLLLLITGKDRIYYYQGTDDPKAQVDLNMTNFAGLRQVIVDYQKKSFDSPVLKAKGYKPENRQLITMIKMTDDARYENMVNVLDEMSITRQNLYNLMDITEREVEMVFDYEKEKSLESSLEKTLKVFPNVSQE